jgi:hypothetical protein
MPAPTGGVWQQRVPHTALPEHPRQLLPQRAPERRDGTSIQMLIGEQGSVRPRRAQACVSSCQSARVQAASFEAPVLQGARARPIGALETMSQAICRSDTGTAPGAARVSGDGRPGPSDAHNVQPAFDPRAHRTPVRCDGPRDDEVTRVRASEGPRVTSTAGPGDVGIFAEVGHRHAHLSTPNSRER